MSLTQDTEFSCPYCFQTNSIQLETHTDGSDQLISDCEVCCRPFLIHYTIHHQSVDTVWAEQEHNAS